MSMNSYKTPSAAWLAQFGVSLQKNPDGSTKLISIQSSPNQLKAIPRLTRKQKITIQDKIFLKIYSSGESGITKREVNSDLGLKVSSFGTTYALLADYGAIEYNRTTKRYTKSVCASEYYSTFKHLLVSERLGFI